MQNIPGIALEEAKEQLTVMKISQVKKSDQQALFADLFNEHADMVQNELAFAPVTTTDKMLEAAPHTDKQKTTVNAAGTEAPVEDNTETTIQDNETRITQDEFEEIKEDLKEYGMSDEEIAALEEKVNSDEGLTWSQLVESIAQKMTAMRSAQLTDDQKSELKSFFSKFGFTEKESSKLISQLENGQFDKVMKQLKAKVEAMPQDKQLLFEKTEIEAFTAALGFSKEFTTKVQELFGNNTLPKDVKQAFTLIRQEMAEMDQKDRELVQAVGKAYAKAMGDESKATTAARQIAEAVDLKPRVAEEKVDIEAEAKEELAEAVKVRKDALPEASARKTTSDSLANKMETKNETQSETVTDKQDTDSEEGDWDNFFNNLQDDNSSDAKGQAQTQAQVRTAQETAEKLTKTGLTEATAKTKSTTAWEKISAPKVMKQVDNAVIRTLNNGTKQLTLQLSPENLGKISVVLQVNGKEVGATIRAESADAAKIISDNIDLIKNTLEAQGLKVEKLDVQTGLTGNQDYSDWYGENEHNLTRDREAMVAMRNHMKQMREQNGELQAEDLQQVRSQTMHADSGLHLIA